MAKKLKKLKLYGAVYFIFGVINAINVLWGIVGGRYSALLLAQSGGISEKNALLFEMLVFVLDVAVILSCLCLGVKGYLYGIGEGYGMVHIPVSKYLVSIFIIRIIVNIVGYFVGQPDYISVATAVAGLCIVFDYNKCARIALES